MYVTQNRSKNYLQVSENPEVQYLWNLEKNSLKVLQNQPKFYETIQINEKLTHGQVTLKAPVTVWSRKLSSEEFPQYLGDSFATAGSVSNLKPECQTQLSLVNN